MLVPSYLLGKTQISQWRTLQKADDRVELDDTSHTGLLKYAEGKIFCWTRLKGLSPVAMDELTGVGFADRVGPAALGPPNNVHFQGRSIISGG